MKDIPLIESSNPLKKPEDEGFTRICSIDDLENKVGRRFIVNDIEVAVFKINNEIFALSNVCPHQQTRLIYDGFIEDEFVVCPAQAHPRGRADRKSGPGFRPGGHRHPRKSQ